MGRTRAEARTKRNTVAANHVHGRVVFFTGTTPHRIAASHRRRPPQWKVSLAPRAGRAGYDQPGNEEPAAAPGRGVPGHAAYRDPPQLESAAASLVRGVPRRVARRLAPQRS